MKICKISLENLNSLVGKHELDLTVEPISSAGIFAITGATGAGKSTLLDAITLALYGRAARYDRPNPEDMMSRHQGSCRAEVEFEVKGEIFRAEWIRRRARDKPDGKMQPPKRYLYDAAGEVLTQGLVEADAKIVEISGLSYERFMRSVLLAQGEFARFLKSKEDERAELLESLTGTEVFSQLSAMVFDETSRRTRELEDQERLLGAISPLEADVREAKETSLLALGGDHARVRSRAKELGNLLYRSEELQRVLASVEEVDKASRSLDQERGANKGELRSLATHRKAAELFPLLGRWDDACSDLAVLDGQLKEAIASRDRSLIDLETGVVSAAALLRRWMAELTEKLVGLRREISEASDRSSSLNQWLKTHRSDARLQECLPDLFEKIATLRNQRQQWSETHKKVVVLKGEIKQGEAEFEKRSFQLEEAKAAFEQAKRAQRAVAGDLEKAIAGKDEATRRVGLERLDRLAMLQQRLEAAEITMHKARAELEPQRGRLAAAAQKRHSAAELLAAHAEHLQTAMLRAGLEEHRANLVPGEACPLCGAEDHPFVVAGTGSKTDELREKVNAARLATQAAENEERLQSKQVAELEAKIEAEKVGGEARRSEIEEICQVLGIAKAEQAQLRELASKWQAELQKVSELRTLAEKSGSELERSRQAVDQLEHEHRSSRTALSRLAEQLSAENEATRKAVRSGESAIGELESALDPFSELVPAPGKELAMRDSLEKRAKAFSDQEQALAVALEVVKSANSQEEKLMEELERLRERASRLEVPEGGEAEVWELDSVGAMDRRLAALDTAATSASAAAEERGKQVKLAALELEKRQKLLEKALEGSEFADADALRSVRLQPESLERLTKLDQRLAEEGERLKGRMESLSENLARLNEQAVPKGEQLAALRLENQQLEAKSEALADEIATLRAEIKADDKNRELLERRGAALGEQREQLAVWRRLNALIGSADGKKFRRFAQGLSLDRLVRHANLHLERLSERYLLARRAGEELGLEIIDLFQASVTRPMSSLSGGESFLASLALALGLSDLAGRNVQIDSLFIDEGFGSLDADTLDEAISALEGLRLREKTVGVISHVELLKERISTQVVVGADSAGRGKLSVIG